LKALKRYDLTANSMPHIWKLEVCCYPHLPKMLTSQSKWVVSKLLLKSLCFDLSWIVLCIK
jgi:hypothetical protein